MPKPYINFLAILLLCALAPLANAILITIEPDDYAAGTNLTNISPYVTLNVVSPGFPGSDVGSIFADDNGALGDPDYVAPTGNLTFGNHAFFVFGEGPDYGGFKMTFNQAVSNVSLLANNEYPPGLSAICAAYDYDGNIIGLSGVGAGTETRSSTSKVRWSKLIAAVLASPPTITPHIPFRSILISKVSPSGTF